MKRKRRDALVPVDRVLRLRTRLLHLLKEEDAPPGEALAAMAAVMGLLAATQRIGRWHMLWGCWRAYGFEKMRVRLSK